MYKRAQDEGTAHVLVALMAVFLVLFVLFLPPQEREALLSTGPVVDGRPGDLPSGILLQKSVGKLEYYPPQGFEHPLPGMHLFWAQNALTLHEFPSFVISRGWFNRKEMNFDFPLDDLEHLRNIILAFDAPSSKGDVRITFNGALLFEGPLRGPTLEPLKLPIPLLREQNTLSFESGSVGGYFWKLNTISIQNPRIIGDLIDLSRTNAASSLTLSPTEKENLLAAKIITTPVCEQEDLGLLSIQVNQKQVYSGVPECNIPLSQSVDLSLLTAGQNTITFSIDRGDLRLERIILDTDLKEVRTFIEYFSVPPGLAQAALRGGPRVVLEVDFVDDNARKRAQLNVNGHLAMIDQTEPHYSRVINPWLLPGARNYIEIVPETPLNIVQVRVRTA